MLQKVFLDTKIFREAMARRRKLNIRHWASDNEGMQSTFNNTNSTKVEGSNIAKTRSSPYIAKVSYMNL